MRLGVLRRGDLDPGQPQPGVELATEEVDDHRRGQEEHGIRVGLAAVDDRRDHLVGRDRPDEERPEDHHDQAEVLQGVPQVRPHLLAVARRRLSAGLVAAAARLRLGGAAYWIGSDMVPSSCRWSRPMLKVVPIGNDPGAPTRCTRVTDAIADPSRALGVDAQVRPTHVNLALLALAVGGFAIGTTEFVTMGLLPEVAEGVGIDIPTAGHVVSAYAAGVVVGAPVLATLGSKLPRKRLLLWLMGGFAVANVLSALRQQLRDADGRPVPVGPAARRLLRGRQPGGGLPGARPPAHVGGLDDDHRADRRQHRRRARHHADRPELRLAVAVCRRGRHRAAHRPRGVALGAVLPARRRREHAPRSCRRSSARRSGWPWASARSASAACSRRSPTSRRR